MRYTSTRDKNVDVSSSWAIAQGISADGGLFVPVEIPKVSLDDIAAMANMSYIERAKRVLSLYLTDFTAEEIVIGGSLKALAAKKKPVVIRGLLAEMCRPIPPQARPYLQRMQLDKAKTGKEKIMRKIVLSALRANRKI